jgi:hypothetical protein
MRVIFLKAAACLMLTFAVSQPAIAQNWVDFKSEYGRYIIAAPKSPALSTADIPLPGGKKTVLHQAMVETSDRAYLSTYVDYPEDMLKGLTVDKILDNARDGAVKGHKLRSERKITIAGHPAREYIIDQQGGLTLITRAVFVPNRLYQVIVVGAAGVEKDPNTRKYLESLALR